MKPLKLTSIQSKIFSLSVFFSRSLSVSLSATQPEGREDDGGGDKGASASLSSHCKSYMIDKEESVNLVE